MCTNNVDFLLHDNNSNIIDTIDWMNEEYSPCLQCSWDIREKCSKEILEIMKRRPKNKEESREFSLYNKKHNGEINQDRTYKKWIKQSYWKY